MRHRHRVRKNSDPDQHDCEDEGGSILQADLAFIPLMCSTINWPTITVAAVEVNAVAAVLAIPRA